MKAKQKDDEALSLKLLDVLTNYTIEGSKITLDFLETQVKYYTKERDLLLENKPFSFQKKKMKAYNEKLEEIDQKIMKLYEEIAQEIQDIAKLQEPIDDKKTKKDKKKKIA
ncbi:MAG: hypothetical protein J6J17_05595 [Bacilli bacterium]|nr:hypothetical protein [Bacilli bacterium]